MTVPACEPGAVETSTNRTRAVLLGLGVVVVVAVAALVVVTGDDGDDPAATSTTTTLRDLPGPTSTTGAPRPTTTVDPAVLDVAIYPDLARGTRFDDPVALVREFATELLGFDTDVVVGELARGDARSGEIEIHPPQSTAVTTVAVREVDEGSWVVLGASTDSIVLDAPAPGATLTSPQPLSGSASAFEGHVDVTLLPDRGNTPIATTFVTGRGDGVLGPFTGELAFQPQGTRAVLVLSAPSAEDGTTNAAMALRVHLA